MGGGGGDERGREGVGEGSRGGRGSVRSGRGEIIKVVPNTLRGDIYGAGLFTHTSI